MKKIFALLLCLMLCISLAAPAFARAERPAQTADLPGMFPVLRSFGAGNSPDGAKASAPSVTVYGSDCRLRAIFCGYGDTVKLRVSASGGTGTLKYQWYAISESNFNTETGEVTYTPSDAISGATSAKYTTPAITAQMDKNDYKLFGCVVTDSKGRTGDALFQLSAVVNQMAPDPVSYNNGVSILVAGFTLNGGYVYYNLNDEGISTGDIQLYSDPVYTFGTKYQIYRKEKGGKWQSLKTITGPKVEDVPIGEISDWPSESVTDYVDKTAKMGVTYTYRYRTYVNGKYTSYSEAESTTFNPFADVSLDEERAKYIAWAYNNDVVKGSVEGSSPDSPRYFYPNAPCTRMNFVMILWKMHGKPTVSGSNPFSDVSGTTSVNAVKWAVKKKLVTGTSATTFSPDDNLSRINIIMILYKLAGSPKASAESQYEDISGSKTSKAVNWAVSKKIISPVDSTHFDPTGNCSRALLVEILCKYNEIYKIL